MKLRALQNKKVRFVHQLVVLKKTLRTMPITTSFYYRIRRNHLTRTATMSSTRDVKTAVMLAISGACFVLLSIPDFFEFVVYSSNSMTIDKLATDRAVTNIADLCHSSFGVINCIIYAFRTSTALKFAKVIKKICIKRCKIERVLQLVCSNLVEKNCNLLIRNRSSWKMYTFSSISSFVPF